MLLIEMVIWLHEDVDAEKELRSTATMVQNGNP